MDFATNIIAGMMLETGVNIAWRLDHPATPPSILACTGGQFMIE